MTVKDLHIILAILAAVGLTSCAGLAKKVKGVARQESYSSEVQTKAPSSVQQTFPETTALPVRKPR